MTIGNININDFFNEDLLSKLRAAFTEFDTSGDGLIGKEELCELFGKLGKSLTKKEANIILREVDADGNGQIDFEELCYLEIQMSGAKPRADLIDYTTYLYDDAIKQLQQWFSLHDMSEDGQITVEAAQRIAEQHDGRASGEEIRDVLSQVSLDGRIGFSQFCAFWAVITNAPKKLNYREYLSYAEVRQCRAIFEEAAGEKKELSRKQVQELLKEKNFVRAKRHLGRILDSFGLDKKGVLDFQLFCNVIVKLSLRRKLWELSPETVDCAQLWRDGFTVSELQMSGFGLRDFGAVRVPARKLYQEGKYSALDLRRAGYSASDLRRAGIGLIELRSSGFSLAELRTAGFSSEGLHDANRTMHGCLSVGDFTLLPQIAKGTLQKWSTAKSQELLNLQRLTMTPLIREHRRPTQALALMSGF